MNCRSRRVIRPDSYLLEPITQAEEVAHGVEEAMGVVVVGVWLGHDRADGRPGVVEELVLQTRGEMTDRSRSASARWGRVAKKASSSRSRICSARLPSC